MDKIRALFFLPKLGHFDFQKREGKASPLPLVASLWVWLNMHQYSWISLNILENAWINCSDYARALKMHDHLTCSTGFCGCLRFSMCHGSEYGMILYASRAYSSHLGAWVHFWGTFCKTGQLVSLQSLNRYHFWSFWWIYFLSFLIISMDLFFLKPRAVYWVQ